MVIAAHADQALALLERPADEESAALGAVAYRRNVAVLHTDARILPRARDAWASWNAQVEDCRDSGANLRMTYHMNRLPRLPEHPTWCVTLNDEARLDPSKIVARHVYDHPVYTPEALRTRGAIRTLSGRRRTYYCGAYLGNGLHEDGVRAGLAVGEAIERRRDYCHDASGALAAVVAEVDNTFGERHLYLLDGRRAAAGSATARFRCTKEMHVSPFLAMDCTHDFELAPIGDRLSVAIVQHEGGRRVLDARLRGRRRPLTTRTVAEALLRYPFITLKTITAIHVEAARLYLKGIPFLSHPGETAAQRTQRALLAAPAGEGSRMRAPAGPSAPGSGRS